METVMSRGLAHKDSVTVQTATELINYLATVGQTGYLRLLGSK